jgi:hypothetical protein
MVVVVVVVVDCCMLGVSHMDYVLVQARVLNGVVKPALEKIKASMLAANPDRPASDLALIAELSKAFELAETSKPGICESIAQEICTTMLR